MASPVHDRDSNGASVNETTGTLRWVKVFVIITIAVVLLFVILMFTRGAGGGHSPSRHFGGQAP